MRVVVQCDVDRCDEQHPGWMSSSNGVANLIPAEPGNVRALKHGVWSERLREPRVKQIYDAVLSAAHVTELDAMGALQIARCEALIESCEEAIVGGGVMNAQAAADIMLRAIRRQMELLDRYGLTPKGRADWAAALGGDGLAAAIERRMVELQRTDPDDG
jgi:hypothetical protein